MLVAIKKIRKRRGANCDPITVTKPANQILVRFMIAVENSFVVYRARAPHGGNASVATRQKGAADES